MNEIKDFVVCDQQIYVDFFVGLLAALPSRLKIKTPDLLGHSRIVFSIYLTPRSVPCFLDLHSCCRKSFKTVFAGYGAQMLQIYHSVYCMCVQIIIRCNLVTQVGSLMTKVTHPFVKQNSLLFPR
jgi:hypothetical protein